MDARKAFEEAYLAHKDRLLTLATALTGDRSAGEDVVHDVFASLIEEPWRLGNRKKLFAFLAVCTRNRALDNRRKRGREARLGGAQRAQRPNTAPDDPVQQVAEREENEALLAMVSRLPGDLREAVTLRIWGQLTFAQIAELYGITKSTAHARYRQALEELRIKLVKGDRNE